MTRDRSQDGGASALRGVRHQSTSAVKARIHWLETLNLVNGRIARSQNSPQDTWHLLAESERDNAYCSGYRAVCSSPRRSNLAVHDSTKAPISEGQLCERCRTKKQKMIRATRELRGSE